MADFSQTTWVEAVTKVGPTNMNRIEAGIKDAAEHNRIGLVSAMPAAAAGNKNWLWIATDTDGTGGLYRSNGAAWEKMPLGSLLSNNTRFGLGGLLSSVNADRAAFYANYNATTDRLIDTSKPGWALFIGAASDTFTVYRAAATAASPSFTSLFSLSSGGAISSPASTLGGDLSGALPNPVVSILSALNLRFGTSGGLRSNAAGFAKLYSNFDPVAGTQIDATLPSWQLSLDGRAGTDQLQLFRSPAGSTTFTLLSTISSTGVFSTANAGLRFGTGGALDSPTADNAKMYSNYNPATDRLIDTSKSGWQVVAGAGGDAMSVWRAPATTGSPVFANMYTVDSTGKTTFNNQIQLGTGGQYMSLAADAGGLGVAANVVQPTGFQVDGSKPSWRILTFYAGGTNDFMKIQRGAPTGNTTTVPTWVDFLTVDSSGNVTALAAMRVGSGGLVRSAAGANTQFATNYNPVTDRLIDTSSPGHRIILGNSGDKVLIERAPAIATSPSFAAIVHVQNDGSMIGGNPPWVTTLPTTGPNGGALQDGQEVNYLADAATGTVWRLKYRAAEAGAFKWYFVGGNPLLSVIDTTQSTSSTNYVDLTTAGPSITTPLAGDYEMEMSALCGGAVNRCFVTPKKNAAATTDADGSETSVAGGTTNTGNAFRRKKVTVAAGDVFKLQYAVLNATSIGFGQRSLQMTPIRVG